MSRMLTAATNLINNEGFRKSLKEASKVMLQELRPPMPQEIPGAIKSAAHLFKNRGNMSQTTVRDAFRNTLVATEVICWFFVGEIIGKGSFIGYQV